MSTRMAFLNTAGDMRWLRDVHLPKLNKMYKSALIFGNEDFPDKIEVFKQRDPKVNAKRVIYVPAVHGGYLRRRG